MDINDQGQIVGFYADANRTCHGYVGDNGRFTGIDPPCAADVPNFDTTVPFGINKLWPVVGQYVEAARVLHGCTVTYGSQDAASRRSIPRRSPASTTASPEQHHNPDINDRGQILLPGPGKPLQGTGDSHLRLRLCASVQTMFRERRLVDVRAGQPSGSCSLARWECTVARAASAPWSEYQPM